MSFVNFNGKEWELLYMYDAFEYLGKRWKIDVIKDIQLKIGDVMKDSTLDDLVYITHAGLLVNDENLTVGQVKKWMRSGEAPKFLELQMMVTEAVVGSLPQKMKAMVEGQEGKKKIINETFDDIRRYAGQVGLKPKELGKLTPRQFGSYAEGVIEARNNQNEYNEQVALFISNSIRELWVKNYKPIKNIFKKDVIKDGKEMNQMELAKEEQKRAVALFKKKGKGGTKFDEVMENKPKIIRKLKD